ncbi:cell division protein FtsQ [Streptomyces cinnamoneus]|uniref:Cell division protein FtsQ n=1 Tax=Streptomyces cinnamoneus TaxID=53446 RepID=A0A2G1XQM1_STRCJ|nr:FtsQ-type POTRA domain-containing protein [Streptomyces cinnamoneus]PHQ53491.1 cell division protein FtsQ [Streptomyces cinnamoneus]PPT12796.1 cell division protein FtsQ [Streptomyces cinnamoneus]
MAGPTTARRGGAKNAKSKSSKSSRSPKSPKASRPALLPSRSRRPGGKPRKGAPRGSGARSRRAGRRRLLLWAVLAALLGAGVCWVLYGSGWLCVTRVEVSGTTVLTADEVREAAEVPLGDPLASVDTDAIEERLRARLRRVETVDVERSWPHAIGLKVTERQPKALLEKAGKFIEIDGSGVRFATVDQAVRGVPRLVLETEDSPSTRRFGTERLEQEAVRVAAALPAAIRGQTLVIRVRSYDSITVELTGGRTVVWGSGERGEVKARTLTALLKAAGGAKRFDVSAPAAPAVSGS